MPRYTQVQTIIHKAGEFRRITGVLPDTFNLMVGLVKESKTGKGRKTGRTNRLGFEDQVLMTLEYLREYRTYAHVAISFEVSESTCHRTVVRVENLLIKSGKFKLPKRKELTSNLEIEAILVDVTEQQIERPKKKRIKNGEKN